MVKDNATVPVEIHWYQVLNALTKLAETRDIERLSVHDVEKIQNAAKVVLDRLKEAGKAPVTVICASQIVTLPTTTTPGKKKLLDNPQF